MPEPNSLLSVIVLVVLAQGMGVWWGAETPYSGALDMSPEGLKKFEMISTVATVSFGAVASVITKRTSPFIASILFCVGMKALYDWEYKKEKGVTLDEG